MQRTSWEYLIWAGFLLVCLVLGLGLGQWAAPQPVIGLVRFEGTIDLESAGPLIDLLEAARKDRRVAAVVLELASPGGLATSSENIFYTLLKMRQEKPVVAVIDGIAVSGGYYVAAAANRIYAPASAYVGNIGTRGPRPPDPSLAPEELSSGPYKLTGGSRFDRIRQLELVKESFLGHVVHMRQNAELNPLQVAPEVLAEARIYLGSEAVAIGLVDVEGSRSDAIAGAAELAGIRRYQVVELESYLGGTAVPTPQPLDKAVQTLVETAPPDAVFLLDTRIPLPGVLEGTEVDQHLLRLRSMAPLPTSLTLPRPPESSGVAPFPAGD